MSDHDRNRLDRALRQIGRDGGIGDVYAFAFGYLAGCVDYAYRADGLADVHEQLARARELIELINTNDYTALPEGADPDRCGYARYYGVPEWHEHDHEACRDANLEAETEGRA
jgi:hypothetical protein